MGCCRSAMSRPLPKVAPRSVAICVNCRASLTKQMQEQINRLARNHARPGSYSVTVEVQCPACRYVNRLSTVYSKQ